MAALSYGVPSPILVQGATFAISAFYAPPLKGATCSFSHYHAVTHLQW